MSLPPALSDLPEHTPPAPSVVVSLNSNASMNERDPRRASARAAAEGVSRVQVTGTAGEARRR